MLHYKGYIAKIDFDDDEYMHGEVINVRDVITFKGKSLEELKQELENSIECYLAFCKKKKREPEKPFSGRMILRMPPELHRKLHTIAKLQNISLNALITNTLENTEFKFSDIVQKTSMPIMDDIYVNYYVQEFTSTASSVTSEMFVYDGTPMPATFSIDPITTRKQ